MKRFDAGYCDKNNTDRLLTVQTVYLQYRQSTDNTDRRPNSSADILLTIETVYLQYSLLTIQTDGLLTVQTVYLQCRHSLYTADDDDDDGCFYIALFSALEQTHCARM